MAWLLAVIFLVVVYYLKTKEKNDRIQNRDNNLEKFKTNIHEQLAENIQNYSQGWSKRKNQFDRDLLINSYIQQAQLALWDRHYKTAMASDNFSKESKARLDTAWYLYLMYYSHTIEYGWIQGLERNEIDKQYENTKEAKETLIAILEAFGYDSDKEYKELKHKIASQYKKGNNK